MAAAAAAAASIRFVSRSAAAIRFASRSAERRRAAVPVKQRPERPAARPLPRPARWVAALAEFRTLQEEYQAWRDGLPEGLADSRTAELLEGVCDVDLDALDVDLPRGFGRD